MVLVPRTEVREEEPNLGRLEICSRYYIVRIDQTKLHRILTTGMFYLIVKDPFSR
jgi:hypothetical protein